LKPQVQPLIGPRAREKKPLPEKGQISEQKEVEESKVIPQKADINTGQPTVKEEELEGKAERSLKLLEEELARIQSEAKSAVQYI